MPDGLVVTFATFHLERQLFFTADVLNHVSGHGGAGYGGRSNRNFAVIIDEQNTIKSKRLARHGFDTFNFQLVARGDPVVFASSF